MKIFITTLTTILFVFILLFVVSGVFGFRVEFVKKEQKVMQEEKNMKNQPAKETKKNNEDTASAQQPIKDITKLSAQILKPGVEGRQVKAGDKITVHYTGQLLDGTKFDSSVDRGQPFSLTIGVGQVIPGWDKGIIGMKVGEQRRLFIPSEFAYGEKGAGNIIKPNDDLIFDVELISIDNKEENVDNENNKENNSIPTSTASTTDETGNGEGE